MIPASQTPTRDSRAPGMQGRGRLVDVAIFCLLTLLVWGLFAFDRGFWKDDLLFVARTDERLTEGPLELLRPQPHTPTRRLQLLPFAAALSTGFPREMVQLIYGLVWFAKGWCVYATALAIFPGRLRLAFLAGAIALCSTGDFYINSTGSLHYSLSILAFFGALLCGLRWLARGGALFLCGAALLIQLSVYTIDAALTSLALAPVLFFITSGFRWTRRLVTLLVVWVLACAPYAVEFLLFMLDDESYAGWGVQEFSVLNWAGRAFTLWLYNWTPWEWSTRSQVFFGWQAPHLIPTSWRWFSALVGSGVVLLWAVRRRAGTGEAGNAGPYWLTVGSCFVFAAASSGMFAFARLSEFFYRTQILSGLWVALVVAALCDSAARAGARVRAGDVRTTGARLVGGLGIATAVGWVGFGIFGGLERQNFFLASWQQQQRELRSLVEAVPGLDSTAYLVLRIPPELRGLATEHTEYARQWSMLLYGDPQLTERVFVISYRGGGCRPEEQDLFCWHERAATGGFEHRYEEHWEVLIPYESLVVATFDAERGGYALERTLPAELRGRPELYAPEKLITPVGASERSRKLLGGGKGLARWLPDHE